MALRTSSIHGGRTAAGGAWLRSPRWDLTWITGSAVLVLVPVALYSLFLTDSARIAINLAVTLLIGGPHMYATITRTALEPRFLRAHRWSFALGVVLVPAMVITLSLTDYVLLVTTFFAWAGLHIVHQASYIAARYDDRGAAPSRASRLVDYAVIGLSLYPVALYKMVQGTFRIGPTATYFPEFLRTPLVYIAAFAAFLAAVAIFVVRTVREVRSGTANGPKIVFVSATAAAGFSVSLFDNLDTAFQGFNTWHSLQYLALTWHINQLRRREGSISRPFVRKLSSPSPRLYYGFVVALTLATGAAIAFVQRVSGFTIDQSYYTVVLSVLLLHYLLDHVLFLDRDDPLVRERLGSTAPIGRGGAAAENVPVPAGAAV